jgi:hypothetical protein
VRSWTFFSLSILLLTGINLLAQNPYIHQYTTHDGLPSNTVYYIYQDSKKFIWFATDAGVSRYDGTIFTNYRIKDGLSSNEVIRIKEDSFGRIWFFNYNGALNYFYQNKIFNENNASFLDSIRVKEFFFDFFQDSDQTIYFYTRYCEIIELDSKNNITKHDLYDKLSKSISGGCISSIHDAGPALRHLCRTSSGDFLFFTRCGILSLKDFSGVPLLNDNSFSIFRVYPGNKQIFYIDRYTNILYQFNNDHLQKAILLPVYSEKKLTSVREDTKGHLWVSYYDKGVYCLNDNQIVKHFDIKEPQAILEDHENNVWVSSMKEGVYKISPYLFDHLYFEKGLFQNNGIMALDPEINGSVWLTNGSNLYLFRNNQFYSLDFKNHHNSLNLIYQLKNGSLLVGEIGSTFYFLEGITTDFKTRKIRFKSMAPLPFSMKTLTKERHEDKIIILGPVSLIISSPDKLFKRKKETLLSQTIYNAFYNLNGDLVVNSKKNFLFVYDSFIPYPELSRFDNKIITDHLIMNDSTELFNIERDSIYLYCKHTFFNLTAFFDSPIDLQIRKIVYDDSILYLSTFRNIYKCNHPSNIIENKPVQLQLLDINFRNIQDILINKDSLYIASDDGLTIIPEVMINKITTHTPTPYFQSIVVNDKETDPLGQELVLRSKNRIAFSFSCINYSSTPVIYSYKLKGVDTAWTTGSSRSVVYQNLSRGNYIFQVRVHKPSAEWSDPVERKFTVKAALWQHPLFFIALTVICVGLIILVIIRRKNIQIKHRDMDHQLITLEQKALQSMMNPHFIFNSLGSIQNYLLQKKSGEAGLYLSQFARLIRQNLNAINAANILLDEEIDRLKNYLDLEKMRMDNKFEYSIEVGENIEADEIEIPSMIIQPFVENAIWHGISSINTQGEITITFHMNDEKSLMVFIEDNGIGMKRSEAFSPKSDKHFHLGMEMTRKRLEILGKKYSVTTSIEFSEPNPGSVNPGTRVKLVVPVSI